MAAIELELFIDVYRLGDAGKLDVKDHIDHTAPGWQDKPIG
jgi:hypothetical protein